MVSSTRVFFRADAGPDIGTGHVMRCLALANAARDQEGLSTCFVGVIPDLVLQERVRNAGHELVLYASRPCTGEWLDRLTCGRGDWVVLDGYSFDARDHAEIRKKGVRLLVVDDMNAIDFYRCDIVLNQNIYGKDLHYVCEEKTVLLLGPRYALLREEFVQHELVRQLTQTRRVLVSLGGADPAGVGLLVLQGLMRVANARLEVLFVAGSSNVQLDKIADAAEEVRQAGHTVEVLRFTNDMPAAMAWADIGIIAAGATSLETAYMGLPCLVLVLADNQLAVAKAMAEEGIGVVLGRYEQVTSRRIADGVSALFGSLPQRQEMIAKGRRLVDGMGARRVVGAMLEY